MSDATRFDADRLDWAKMDHLIPAVVQHARSGTVLMVGYMNRAALDATTASGHVTFYSRSKDRLWTKGESSGHVLRLVSVAVDCDRDALLILAEPAGPTCHTGAESCFDVDATRVRPTLAHLETYLRARAVDTDADSYTRRLIAAGTPRIAQKVGEEGVEVALAGVVGSDDELRGEAADLLYHLIVLLQARGLGLGDALAELEARHRA